MMSKYYFSSDFHLGHTNVIKYDKRPFMDSDEMDEAIITNCMDMFTRKDHFYYLGDFALANMKYTEHCMKLIASTGVTIYFIRGNHDKSQMIKLYEKYGTYLGEQRKIKVGEQSIVLNHYRMDVWENSHHGTWHLHGHSHHNLPERPNALCIDVGCNGWDYKPLEFSQIADIMSKKIWVPIDHHTGERD